MSRGGLQPSVALRQAGTFYLSRADRGSAVLLEEFCFWSLLQGVILALPQVALSKLVTSLSLGLKIM